MILLQDQFQGLPVALGDQLAQAAPLALADHASGSVTVGIDGGAMTVTVAAPSAAPPAAWLLAGGLWADSTTWDDTAFWEDS